MLLLHFIWNIKTCLKSVKAHVYYCHTICHTDVKQYCRTSNCSPSQKLVPVKIGNATIKNQN